MHAAQGVLGSVVRFVFLGPLCVQAGLGELVIAVCSAEEAPFISVQLRSDQICPGQRCFSESHGVRVTASFDA